MFRYTSSSQISLDDFMDNLGKKLNSQNRWVKLAQQIPWDELAKIYAESLSEDMGRPCKDARLVIGAIIIKHKKGLPDEEVIPEIQENPYLQYFVGLKEFTHDPIFDPSLLNIRLFTFSVFAAVILFLSLFMIVFLLPFFLVHPSGYAMSRVGYTMVTPFIFLFFLSPLSGIISDRIGSRHHGVLDR